MFAIPLQVSAEKPSMELVVLGSGGPIADNHRASSGYIIKINGKSKILVDAGGGTFQRLGQAGLNAGSIDIVLLTHLHIDHTSDLPAIFKSSYFQKRGNRPINIFGPNGNKTSISTKKFIDRLFNPNVGAYSYFEQFAKKVTKSNATLVVTNLSVDKQESIKIKVWKKGGLKITAANVKHGPMPTLAYRVEYKGSCITFSGDLNSTSGNLVTLAKGCGILVYDTSLNQNAKGIALKLHSLPFAIGRTANKSGVKALLLSHIMPPAEKSMPSVKKIIKSQFNGKVLVAKDLMKIPVPNFKGK